MVDEDIFKKWLTGIYYRNGLQVYILEMVDKDIF